MTLPASRSGARGLGTPEERLLLATSRVARAWIRMGREEARSLGLSLAQLVLLRGLRERGPAPAVRWAEMVGASPSALTGLLDALGSEGYVRRVRGTTDRRQVVVALTPAGRRLADRLAQKYRQRWHGYCRGKTGSSLGASARTLGSIADRMEAEACP
jgi:DNA-binding MarR family transcriptional regulator